MSNVCRVDFSKRHVLALLKLFAILVVLCACFMLLLSLHASSKRSKTGNYVDNGKQKRGNDPISGEARVERSAFSTEEMRNVRARLNARKSELGRCCRTIERTGSNLENALSNMIIDTKHGVSWCPIYKAASSTWMKHFATLGGALTESTMESIRRNVLQINTVVRRAFPRDRDIKKTYRLNETKKFLIVRHPFERLVSAYRDKLEHAEGRDYYYKRFGRHIAHRYHRYRKPNETRIEPTFAEFLRFIAEEKYFDEHWAPFVDTCEPCTIEYDYILKFDTFDRDQKFLIQELGLDLYLPENELRNINPRGVTTPALVERYMRDVPRPLLDKINKVYENDFKLFSYSPV
ncbi:carbohydrate sulfotransferase 9-like isoform X2 [Ceratina calcarata]|uniref:Carbohydrate sulfotransferase n=1 Tax=Ceratina calcarata TaxID=156304 RepID=A0AAJ7WGI2_9HYME|nr:carbohydrate sulfotransferase 9-like isoform X2 [Ceratina calcarata]